MSFRRIFGGKRKPATPSANARRLQHYARTLGTAESHINGTRQTVESLCSEPYCHDASHPHYGETCGKCGRPAHHGDCLPGRFHDATSGTADAANGITTQDGQATWHKSGTAEHTCGTITQSQPCPACNSENKQTAETAKASTVGPTYPQPWAPNLRIPDGTTFVTVYTLPDATTRTQHGVVIRRLWAAVIEQIQRDTGHDSAKQ